MKVPACNLCSAPPHAWAGREPSWYFFFARRHSIARELRRKVRQGLWYPCAGLLTLFVLDSLQQVVPRFWEIDLKKTAGVPRRDDRRKEKAFPGRSRTARVSL